MGQKNSPEWLSVRHLASTGRAAINLIPTDDLVLWLEAEDLTATLSDTDPISSWPDRSGVANDAVQTTGSLQPLLNTGEINSLATVRFDGGDHFILPQPFDGVGGEIFGVVKVDNDPSVAGTNPGEGRGGLWDFGSHTLATHYPYSDGTIYEQFGTTSRKTTGNPTPLLTSPRLYNVSSGASTYTTRLDGNVHYTTATNTVGWNAAPRIGASVVGGFFMAGDIAAIIGYNRILTTTERALVQVYVADRWGLTIA